MVMMVMMVMMMVIWQKEGGVAESNFTTTIFNWSLAVSFCSPAHLAHMHENTA